MELFKLGIKVVQLTLWLIFMWKGIFSEKRTERIESLIWATLLYSAIFS